MQRCLRKLEVGGRVVQEPGAACPVASPAMAVGNAWTSRARHAIPAGAARGVRVLQLASQPMCGAELQALPDGVQRVARCLSERAHAHTPQMLDGAARTAQQAADALGVQLGQIAKSIIFRRLADEAAVLVITSGDLRVDEAKVAAITGPIGRADAGFVKRATGFSIGGVSPVANQNESGEPPILLIDEQLDRFEVIWAAAGHPHAVFQLTLHDLSRWTGETPCDVTVAG